MPHAIELLFDDASAAAVRVLWSTLAEVGADDYVIRNGSIPHVALAVIDNLPDPASLTEKLSYLAQQIEPARLKPTAIACFESPAPVVYLGFAKDDFLAAAHQAAMEVLADAGLSNNDLYQPGRWVPHCTLAMEFEADKLDAVLSASKAMEWKVPFCADRLGLVEYPPTRLAWSSPLGKPVEHDDG